VAGLPWDRSTGSALAVVAGTTSAAAEV